jgi:DTW domain-containing protein YfiP
MRRDGGTEPAAPGTGWPEVAWPGGEPGFAAAAESPQPAIDNRLFVLVLQHPQERGEPRATAAATVAALRHARLVVGLSWPNLTRALGWPTSRPADPGRWGVLYLGSVRPRSLRQAPSQPQGPARRKEGNPKGGAIIALNRDGNPLPDADRVLRGLDGIVLLDGTWSQAKTLWWRNPWLLKLHRFVLNPPEPARLGRLRREPRPEALSTLEAASLVLRHAEPDPEPADALIAVLDRLIAALGGSPQGVIDQGVIDQDATGRGAGDPQDRRSFSPRSRYARRPPHHRGRSATG